MGFVLRRSLPSISGLLALLLSVGVAVVVFLNAPVWFPAVFAIAVIGLQYLVNPWLIQWLVPATVIPQNGRGYETDHVVGALVAKRCHQTGIPLVKLGVVDDGTPNAFTFGRTPHGARIWVTRGLLERLDERELDAVVAHEVGHIRHWDFVVMTVAAVVPMILYLFYILARGNNRLEARAIALGAYLAYLVSYLTLLALSRARELAADHWSCEATADGDALAAALVKVAYGMGQADAERKERVAALLVEGKDGKKEAAKTQARWNRAQSMRAMGIFEPRQAEAMATAFAAGIDPQRAIAALRWDVLNPWGRTLEKMSSHPLVARRIAVLEGSGLPGKPSTWTVLGNAAITETDPEVVASVRRRFWTELVIAVAPWVILLAVILGALSRSMTAVGGALTSAGLLFAVKQFLRYPPGFQSTPQVAGLLERLDAGPVVGIPVELTGTIIGRGFPGYVLSPDLVLQDQTGFVPLLYRQPIPFARTWFGLFQADRWMGQDVVARGWYRRMPGPVVELRDIRRYSQRARTWEWVARQAAAWALVAVGLVMMLVSTSA